MEEQRKPLTVQQRMAIGRRMKRLAPKMMKARMRTAKRMASPEKMMKKAMKAAKVKIRKKVAGKKGLNYAQLSPSEKMSVDKMVMKKATPVKIKALAKKLMPTVRKKEMTRVKLARGQKNESVDLDALFEEELAPKMFEDLFNEDNKRLKEEDPCWKGYKQLGMKKKGDKKVPNCVPEEMELEEAEYKGRTVTLNDPFRSNDGKKKFYVYVKNDKDNIIKLGFGDPNMEIKRDDPGRRASFRARHGCDNPGPKWKAKYWSCYQWRAGHKVDD